MKKCFMLLAAVLLTISMSAANLTGKRIYVNPGHGSFGKNDRPMPTISYPNLPLTGMPDTCGFYESNTNLQKAWYLGQKLKSAGATVLHSHTECGPWPYAKVNGDYPDYTWEDYSARADFEKYNRSLVEITEEVEANNIDFFISIHSNSATDGATTNYPIMLYRGPDDYTSANSANGLEYVTGSYEKAAACYTERCKVMQAGIDVTSNNETVIRGDWSFYGTSSNRTHANGKTYKGYLGVLKHGASGFYSEGYFHTYQPARHRALNYDYCHMEGLDYYRGIINYYGADKETVGYIVGTIKDHNKKMSHSLFTYAQGSNDQWVPCNGAEVILKKGGVEVARYTVDNNYNGLFIFKDLTPGDDYTLEASCDGYYDNKTTLSVKANETTYPMIYLGDTTQPTSTITYQLNGGVTNDYGWMSKNDMFQACMADCGVTGLASLDQLQAAGDASFTTITGKLTDVSGMLNNSKWDWLEAYIMSVQNAEAGATTLVEGTTSAGWRYAVAAFFLEMKRASWPISADFSTAGKVEAFQSAWKHGFANPTSTATIFTLNAPYKEGDTFLGWYWNEHFLGEKATTITPGVNGTLYACFTNFSEYTPHIAAYKLNVAAKGNNYVFTFEANADAKSANLVFYANGAEAGKVPVTVVKGKNTITVASTELPETKAQELTWAVELEGDAIDRFGIIASDKSLIESTTSRLFNAVNTNPESDNFGHIYVMHRAGSSSSATALKSGLWEYDFNYNKLNTEVYKGGIEKFGNPVRMSIDNEGYLYLTDWADATSGIYMANTDDLTQPYTQFFAGTRESNGAFNNGGVYTGSSTPGCYVYGEGKNTKLYVYNEDAKGTLPSNGIAVYNIGQTNGSILHQWQAFPSAVYALTGQSNTEGNVWATSHGFFVSQVRTSGTNNTTATSLKFYANNGTEQLSSASDLYKNIIMGSDAGGYVVSADESTLIFNDGDMNFLVFDITWEGDKPVLTLSYTIKHGIAKIRQMNWDFAGNIVCSGDDGLHIVSLPSDENKTLVPAKKSLSIKINNQPTPVGVKEAYTYDTRNDKYSLENNWIVSNIEGNFETNKPGTNDYVRGMDTKDGIIYFINRETASITRIDGATGAMLTPINITGTHLFETQTNGTWASAVTFPYNDIHFDSAGNCLIGSLSSGKNHFMIYEVNLTTGAATLLIDECLWDNPTYDQLPIRFDAFGVYGDIHNNACIMAANGSSQTFDVFRWTITNGTVHSGERINITVNANQSLAAGKAGWGGSPRIFPQNESGSLFYVDGYNTLPMLCDDGGNVIGDFIMCSTGTQIQNNASNATTLVTGHNGCQEFEVGGEHFLIMAATNTASTPPSAFALYRFANRSLGFESLEPLWFFPNEGFGTLTNGSRVAIPSVEVIDDKTATIYLYAQNNGYASYTLTTPGKVEPTKEYATICSGESYTWQGNTYTQSGTYTTENAILYLTVLPTQVSEEHITACDSYTWNGQTYTQSGTYTYTTTAANGCDSIATLYLTINNSEIGATEYATICYGETYTWNGQTYSTAGEYTLVLSSTLGCDSVATLHLTILPEAIVLEESITLNEENLPYLWRGQQCYQSGKYLDSEPFANYPYCDSVIHVLNLTTEAPNKLGDNLYWHYSNNTLTITGSGAMYDDPDRLSYRNETWYPARVNHVSLSTELTHIGSVAFADCANLTHIDIPSSVTSIGDGAFSWTGLQSVTIPASVTKLGEQVFEACNNLHTIIYEGYPTVISNQAIHPLIGCVHLDTVIAPAALWHCANADKALENRYGVPHKARYIEVTDGNLTNQAVKYIAQNATALEVLDLTNTTNTTLPYGALYNSYLLTQLYLPAYIETLPESMIEGGSRLSEITIPATVTEIGNYAFAGCVNIWRMTVEATTPPKVYENTFDRVKRSISVLVPAGSEQAYREAEYWREFFIDNTDSPLPISNCQKIFHEDQILILRNGKAYTTMGQLVNTEE